MGEYERGEVKETEANEEGEGEEDDDDGREGVVVIEEGKEVLVEGDVTEGVDEDDRWDDVLPFDDKGVEELQGCGTADDGRDEEEDEDDIVGIKGDDVNEVPFGVKFKVGGVVVPPPVPCDG